MVISATEAKRKYKLTDAEIRAANLFTMAFSGRFYSGVKYLIEEIEELAETLTEDLPANDKRKQAYVKQKRIRDEIQNEIDKKIEYKNNVKDILQDILMKIDPTIDINKDFDIPGFLDNYALDINISPNDTALLISDKIKILVEERDSKKKKQKEIDERIAAEWEIEKYITMAKSHVNYCKYINCNNEDIDECMDGIIHLIDCEKRKEIIDERIRTRWTVKKHIKMAMDHPNYTKYVTGKDKGINRCFNGIRRDVLAMIEKENRIRKIDRQIKKAIPDDYISVAGYHDAYYEYIDSDDKDIKETMKILTAFVQPMIDRRNRVDKKDEIIKLYNIKKFPVDQYKIYQQYIEGEITEDQFMECVNIYVQNQKEQADRTNKIHEELNKHDMMPFLIANKTTYDQYIEGQITLESAMESIRNNNNSMTKRITLDIYIDCVYSTYEIRLLAKHSSGYLKYVNEDGISLETAKQNIQEAIDKEYGIYLLNKQWLMSAERKDIRNSFGLDDSSCNMLEVLLFEFCDSNDCNTQEFYDYEEPERQYLHYCCDALRLYHKPGDNYINKTIIVTKPKNWNMDHLTLR